MTDKEINEAVAKKLGVWIREYDLHHRVPDYCHSIEVAWEIVEKVTGDGFTISIDGTWRFGKRAFQCRISHDEKAFSEIQDTPPMAICLAFLKLGDKS